MFRKQFHVKTNIQLKGSDKKKLRDRLKSPFSAEDERSRKLDELISPKSDLTAAKIVTSENVTVKVYCLGKCPLVVESEDSGGLAPTVYLLWKVANLVPILYVPEMVLGRIQKGADVMLPGLLPLGNAALSPENLGNLPRDGICAISLVGGSSDKMLKGPVAVGQTLMSSAEMIQCGMKGKGVNILHCFGDFLWEMGPREQPPVTDLADLLVEMLTLQPSTLDEHEHNETTGDGSDQLLVSEEGTSGEALANESSQACKTDESDDAGGETSDDDQEKDEEVLFDSFLIAIKTKLKKDQLPILASKFLNQCLLPSVPVGKKFDIRQTKYKKLGVFLREMQDLGFVTLSETKGVISIESVVWRHEMLKEIEIPLADETCAQSSASTNEKNGFALPTIEEMLSVTAPLVPILQKVNPKIAKGDLLSEQSVRELLKQYVQLCNLQEGDKVTFDDNLNSLLQHNASCISWADFYRKSMSKMTRSCRITFTDGRTVVRKTKLPLISMKTAKKMGNKQVTLVDNLSVYGIRPDDLAHRVQVGVACSACLNDAVPQCEGPQVQVQGNQIKFIGKLLLEDYKLPKKYVQGLELATGKKNKNR